MEGSYKFEFYFFFLCGYKNNMTREVQILLPFIYVSVPDGHNYDSTDHHPEQRFSVLFVRRPKDRVGRQNGRPLQDPGLIVQPEPDLNAQVTSKNDGRVASENVKDLLLFWKETRCLVVKVDGSHSRFEWFESHRRHYRDHLICSKHVYYWTDMRPGKKTPKCY